MASAYEKIVAAAKPCAKWDNSFIPWKALRRRYLSAESSPTILQAEEFEYARSVYYSLGPAEMARVDEWYYNERQAIRANGPVQLVFRLVAMPYDPPELGMIEVYTDTLIRVAPSQLPISFNYFGYTYTLSLANDLLVLSLLARTYTIGDTTGITVRLDYLLAIGVYIRATLPLRGATLVSCWYQSSLYNECSAVAAPTAAAIRATPIGLHLPRDYPGGYVTYMRNDYLGEPSEKFVVIPSSPLTPF